MRHMNIDQQVALHDYLEIEKGLDPIGASDMISDVFNFARLYIAEGGPTEPAVIWDAFTRSPMWKQYYPDAK